MSDLLRLEPFTYPYSAPQLRADEPRLSLSTELPDRELASLSTLDPPVLVVRVTPASRPPDARNERYDDTAALIEGAWHQVWVARGATAQEQAEWDAAHQPPPDWLGFAGWLYVFPPIAAAMDTARLSTDPQGEPATTGLPAALQEARLNQNYPAWAATWGQFLLASQMPANALAEIVAKAQACSLPAGFIAALQPLPSEAP